MADKALVLDANVLIRAVLGVRVRTLIEQHAGSVPMYAPESAFQEVREHLPSVFERRGLSPAVALLVFERLTGMVSSLPEEFYTAAESEARARLGRRDPEDWPVLACALMLECPIWTEDTDFFGSGVPTWTTATIEPYLASTTESE